MILVIMGKEKGVEVQTLGSVPSPRGCLGGKGAWMAEMPPLKARLALTEVGARGGAERQPSVAAYALAPFRTHQLFSDICTEEASSWNFPDRAEDYSEHKSIKPRFLAHLGTKNLQTERSLKGRYSPPTPPLPRHARTSILIVPQAIKFQREFSVARPNRPCSYLIFLSACLQL